MSEQAPDPDPDPGADGGLSPEELEAESGETLPERRAMSTVHADVTIPSDAALVADVLAGEDADDDPEEPDAS